MGFTLDRAGVGRFLRSADMTAATKRIAERAASEARAMTDMPVEVTTSTTDRAAATVAITHAGGAAEQAKRGTLTRAASAVGLTIRAWR